MTDYSHDKNNGEWKPTLSKEVKDEIKLIELMGLLEKTIDRIADIAGERMNLVCSVYIIDLAKQIPIEALSKYFVVGKPTDCIANAHNLYDILCEDAENALKEDEPSDKE